MGVVFWGVGGVWFLFIFGFCLVFVYFWGCLLFLLGVVLFFVFGGRSWFGVFWEGVLFDWGDLFGFWFLGGFLFS